MTVYFMSRFLKIDDMLVIFIYFTQPLPTMSYSSSSDVYSNDDCDFEYYNERTGSSQYVTIRRVNGSASRLIMRGRYTYDIVLCDVTRRYRLAGTTNPAIYPRQ
jgi:hypothetical protein